MKCRSYIEWENGDILLIIKTYDPKDDAYIRREYEQHPGCEANLRFNDGDPQWYIRILDPKLKLKARLTFG